MHHVSRLLVCLGVSAVCSGAAAEQLVLTSTSDLDKALQSPQPGDVFILANGTWRDTVIELHGVGTREQPITLKAETPGKADLTGRSRVRFSGEHIIVEGLVFTDVQDVDHVVEFRTESDRLAHHCRLTSCAITSRLSGEGREGSKWVSVYGTDNRVDHCYFSGKANEGQTLVVWVTETPGRHRIDHNHFGPRPVLGRNGGETVRIGTSSVSLSDSLSIVEDNYFEECDGELEIVSNKSCGNIYRRNVFDRCSGTLTLRHGNRCTVEGNLFLGRGKRGSGGVRFVGEDHRVVNNYFEGLRGEGARSAISFMNGVPDGELNEYAQVLRGIVAFNTIVDCDSPMCVGVRASRATLPPTGCTVAHNVFLEPIRKQGGRRNHSGPDARPGPLPGREQEKADRPLTGEGPLVDWQTQPLEWTWSGNLRQASPGAEPMGGVRMLDLKFSRAPGGLMRPTAGSPAVDAVTESFFGVVVDVDGDQRRRPFDAGCDEFRADNGLPGILSSGDYGPGWRSK